MSWLAEGIGVFIPVDVLLQRVCDRGDVFGSTNRIRVDAVLAQRPWGVHRVGAPVRNIDIVVGLSGLDDLLAAISRDVENVRDVLARDLASQDAGESGGSGSGVGDHATVAEEFFLQPDPHNG